MNRKIKSDEEIRHILRGICDLTLPKSDWTHDAHFAAAIAMLSDSNFDTVIDMPRTIKAYNLATGVQNTDHEGYHHTITIASIFAAKSMMTDDRMSMVEVLENIVAEQFGKSTWLLSYWSKDLLFSVEARKAWVEPDLQKLPFETALI